MLLKYRPPTVFLTNIRVRVNQRLLFPPNVNNFPLSAPSPPAGTTLKSRKSIAESGNRSRWFTRTSNIRLGLKQLFGANTLAYFATVSMTKYRNIIKIDTRCQFNKTFPSCKISQQNKLERSPIQVFRTSLIFPKKFAWAGSEPRTFQFISFHSSAELQYN